MPGDVRCQFQAIYSVGHKSANLLLGSLSPIVAVQLLAMSGLKDQGSQHARLPSCPSLFPRVYQTQVL